MASESYCSIFFNLLFTILNYMIIFVVLVET